MLIEKAKIYTPFFFTLLLIEHLSFRLCLIYTVSIRKVYFAFQAVRSGVIGEVKLLYEPSYPSSGWLVGRCVTYHGPVGALVYSLLFLIISLLILQVSIH